MATIVSVGLRNLTPAMSNSPRPFRSKKRRDFRQQLLLLRQPPCQTHAT
jgi:hypothetical protein